MSTKTITYALSDKERQLFTRIVNPCEVNGKRLTRPVVVAFQKSNGLLAGLSTLAQWRRACENVPGYEDAYRFELHNMW